MTNSEQLEALKAKNNRLEKLLEISLTLNSNLHLDNLLLSIVQVAKQLTHTEAASILLLDQRTGALYFEATTSQQREALAHMLVPVEGSIAGWIVSNSKPLILNDAAHDPRHFTQPDKKTDFITKALLGVPLEVKEKTIGVLEVLNPVNDQAFTPEDVHTITILASQAAVAIENARLFRQSDQIADIVHELRTPITSIMGYSSLLVSRDDLNDEAKKSFATTIQQEAKQLADMINNFLDLARLETRRTHLDMVPVDLTKLISETVSLLNPHAQRQDLKLECNSLTAPMTITADPAHLKQVLVNLISNAIKYNKPGGKVDIQVEQTPQHITIIVADTGVGIDQEHLEQVFNKFFRVLEQEHRVKGTGLGLSIVKEIVEAHGGTITVQSELNQGSTFTVKLPSSRS